MKLRNALNIFGNNSNISINNKTYTGNNIVINDDGIYVDGVLQGESDDKKKVEIKIISNVERIESKESITIIGNVNARDVVAGTSVNCDDISGNVRAGTSVNCDDVRGDVTAGTTVNCDKITGNANASRINY